MLELLIIPFFLIGIAAILLFLKYRHDQRVEWLNARDSEEEAFIQTVMRNSWHIPATEGRGAYEFEPHHCNREEAVRFVRIEWPQIQAGLRAKDERFRTRKR